MLVWYIELSRLGFYISLIISPIASLRLPAKLQVHLPANLYFFDVTFILLHRYHFQHHSFHPGYGALHSFYPP